MSKVSVIIPAFNSEAYVKAAVLSALAQSYTDIEVLVIDDGSTDETFEIVTAIDGATCIYKPNGGVSSARNFGALRSTGKYLAFLDADDLWHPQKIEAQVALLDRYEDCDLTYCRLCQSQDHYTSDVLRRYIIDGNDDIPHTIHKTFESTLVKPYFGTSGVVVRRSAFDRVGGFNTKLPYAEDVDFYLRMLVSRPLVAVLEFPAIFKRHVPGSLGDNSIAGYEMLFAVYESLLASQPDLIRYNPRMISRAFAELTRRYASSLLRSRRTQEARQAAVASFQHWPNIGAVSVLLSASTPSLFRRRRDLPPATGES